MSISRRTGARPRARRHQRASAPASGRGARGRESAGRVRCALLGEEAPLSLSHRQSPRRSRARSRLRAWRVPRRLDVAAMHEAAQHLVGRHDFTTFRSTECQAKSPVKTLDQLDVSATATTSTSATSARSFLHNQVRSMVGSLVQVGDGKWSADDLAAALAARDRARLRHRGAARRTVSGARRLLRVA